jgi:hypothetical protein
MLAEMEPWKERVEAKLREPGAPWLIDNRIAHKAVRCSSCYR